MAVATRSGGMPLEGPAPPEIPLPDAPLVSVVAQVRFAMHLPVGIPARVSAFQEAIGDHYPHLEPHTVAAITVTPSGIAAQSGSEGVVHWRFSDQARDWRITLTPEFITLETHAYKSRDDFIERFEGSPTGVGGYPCPEARDAIRHALHRPNQRQAGIGDRQVTAERGIRCRGLSRGERPQGSLSRSFSCQPIQAICWLVGASCRPMRPSTRTSYPRYGGVLDAGSGRLEFGGSALPDVISGCDGKERRQPGLRGLPLDDH